MLPLNLIPLIDVTFSTPTPGYVNHTFPFAQNIEVIELKKYFGVPFKVWIQSAVKSEQHWLDEEDHTNWVLSRRVTRGDLLLMYRGHPTCSITDIFSFSGVGKSMLVAATGIESTIDLAEWLIEFVNWMRQFSWMTCEATGSCVPHPSCVAICEGADC
jgi:hypothetical protein